MSSIFERVTEEGSSIVYEGEDIVGKEVAVREEQGLGTVGIVL